MSNLPAPLKGNTMKNIVRVAFSILLVAGVAACAKKAVKPPPPPVETTSTETNTQPSDNGGRYTRDSLDTDSCLRQRVVYSISTRARSSRSSRHRCRATRLT